MRGPTGEQQNNRDHADTNRDTAQGKQNLPPRSSLKEQLSQQTLVCVVRVHPRPSPTRSSSRLSFVRQALTQPTTKRARPAATTTRLFAVPRSLHHLHSDS